MNTFIFLVVAVVCIILLYLFRLRRENSISLDLPDIKSPYPRNSMSQILRQIAEDEDQELDNYIKSKKGTNSDVNN